jgi:hypothetical protein
MISSRAAACALSSATIDLVLVVRQRLRARREAIEAARERVVPVSASGRRRR